MIKWLFFLVSMLTMLACSSRPNEPELTPMQLAATYGPRVGIAVRTASRTCVAIKNGNLAASSPITLVVAQTPQFFGQARIKAPSEETCPITKDGDPGLSSYELNLPDGYDRIPKLQPMIAVVGDASPFLLTNITVQADLDRNREARMFRICATGSGFSLSVWSGVPLTSGLLWSGSYYGPAATGHAAACTPAERGS